MSTTVIVILAVASFIGVCVAAAKKDKPQSKLIAIVCFIVLMICAGMYFYNSGVLGNVDKATRDQLSSYHQFERASAKKIVDYLKEKYPSDKVVIIAPGGTDYQNKMKSSTITMALLDFMKDNPPEVVGLPYTLDPNNPMAMVSNGTAEDYNQIFKDHSDASLFIITENIPYNPRELFRFSIMKDKKHKQRIILVNGEICLFGQLIKSGFIAAAVTTKPTLTEEDYEKLAPRDLNKAFDMRFLFLTPENVEEIASKTSGLFR